MLARALYCFSGSDRSEYGNNFLMSRCFLLSDDVSSRYTLIASFNQSSEDVKVPYGPQELTDIMETIFL